MMCKRLTLDVLMSFEKALVTSTRPTREILIFVFAGPWNLFGFTCPRRVLQRVVHFVNLLTRGAETKRVVW